MTKWICQDDATGEGPGGQSNGLCHPAVLAKLSATATTPGGGGEPGWLGSQRHNAPPSCSPTLDSPRDCRPREEQHPAGCTRKGRASGKESATSPPPPRPHLGSTGGRARPAPGSSESGPPPYALRVPPAGLAALGPEAIRLGGVVGVGPTREGGVTEPRTSLGISPGFAVSTFVFFHPSLRGLNL